MDAAAEEYASGADAALWNDAALQVAEVVHAAAAVGHLAPCYEPKGAVEEHDLGLGAVGGELEELPRVAAVVRELEPHD